MNFLITVFIIHIFTYISIIKTPIVHLLQVVALPPHCLKNPVTELTLPTSLADT